MDINFGEIIRKSFKWPKKGKKSIGIGILNCVRKIRTIIIEVCRFS